MNSIDTLLDKIDLYFQGKKSSETYLVFAMVFALIGFIFYSYLFPVTEKMLNQTMRHAKEIEKKLKDEQSYLASVSRDGDDKFFLKKQNQISKMQNFFWKKQLIQMPMLIIS